MNDAQKGALAIMTVALIFVYVLHSHMKMKHHIATLFQKDNLCKMAAQCGKESFVVAEDEKKDDAMKKCIDVLNVARGCLETASHPMECYSFLVKGENCLKDELVRAHMKSSAQVQFSSRIAHALGEKKLPPMMSLDDAKYVQALKQQALKHIAVPVHPSMPSMAPHAMAPHPAMPVHPSMAPHAMPHHASIPVHPSMAPSVHSVAPLTKHQSDANHIMLDLSEYRPAPGVKIDITEFSQ